MARMNWQRANNRDQIRDRGGEGIRGGATGNRSTRRTAQNEPPQRSAIPELAEPLVVAKFFRNRAGEFITVALRQFNGRPLLDIRLWFTGRDGVSRPTHKGIAVNVLRLPELAKAISKAEFRARELGLIESEETAGV